jgi:hypothetical protein
MYSSTTYHQKALFHFEHTFVKKHLKAETGCFHENLLLAAL